ncbi:hypothetical protein ACGFX8_35955 [Streptomyces sp. NPDC048362]|uniref:hypothetical protein n=1 Tax=Streptomyces sp. NPDC048362 TaxID=3365539 RepID=UPI0037168B75
MGSDSKLVESAVASDAIETDPIVTTTEAITSEEYFPLAEKGLGFVPEQAVHHLSDAEQHTAHAERFINLFVSDDDPRTRAEAACWLHTCSAEASTLAILEVASRGWPRQRDAAMDLLAIHGPRADAELRRNAHHPVLSSWIQSITGLPAKQRGEETAPQWLAVETIARVRETCGVSKAYTALWQNLGQEQNQQFEELIAKLLSTKHPQAMQLAAEFRTVHGTQAVRKKPPLYALQYDVCFVTPANGGDLRIPGDHTLEQVHLALLRSTGWEEAEQHLFEVGSRRYSETVSPVHGTLPTHSLRVDQAFDIESRAPVVYMHGEWHKVEIRLVHVEQHSI